MKEVVQSFIELNELCITVPPQPTTALPQYSAVPRRCPSRAHVAHSFAAVARASAADSPRWSVHPFAFERKDCGTTLCGAKSSLAGRLSIDRHAAWLTLSLEPPEC